MKKLLIGVLFAAIVSSAHIVSASFSYGDAGNDVLVVQQYLHRIGMDIDETGVVDAQTVAVAADYQHKHFLPETGELDDQTLTMMFGSPYVPEDCRLGRGMEWFPIRVLRIAQEYIGVPYVWGGATPEGFDCSGYVQYVFAQAGLQLPRTADEQFLYGYQIEEKDRLLPGDLVFFETYEPGPSHIGIYFNATYFLHADSVTGMITFDTLERAYREETYLGARRMVLW